MTDTELVAEIVKILQSKPSRRKAALENVTVIAGGSASAFDLARFDQIAGLVNRHQKASGA
jgi:hypothetical protein